MTPAILIPKELHLHSVTIETPLISKNPSQGSFILPDGSQELVESILRWRFIVTYQDVRGENQTIDYDAEMTIDTLPNDVKISLDTLSQFVKSKCHQKIGLTPV